MRGIPKPILGVVSVPLCLLLHILMVQATEVDRYVVVKDGRAGFIDHTGTVVIPLQYDSALDFEDGLARVEVNVKTTSYGARTPGVYGFIDPRGEWVIPPTLEYVRSFSEGLAVVKLDDHWGYIDKRGTVVIAARFKRAHDFNEGRAAAEPLFGPGVYIDTTGQTVFSAAATDMGDPGSFAEGLVDFQKGKSTVSYLDHQGNIVLKTPYEIGRSFSQGRAAVRADKGWGFIDRQGQLVIAATFNFAWGFREGLAPVLVKNRWGFIDRQGKSVITPAFEDVDAFSEGLARVTIKEKYGYIDRTGKVVIPAVWDDPQSFAWRFRGGLALVGRVIEGKLYCGYINKSGQILWEPSR